MAVRIYTTGAGVELTPKELDLLRGLVAERGRATLLVSSFAERDICRHDLARADLGLGVEVATFDTWLASLWELMGDGRHPVTRIKRELLFSDILSRRDAASLAPLSNSQGIVRMLSRMARDVLPGIAGVQGTRLYRDSAPAHPKSAAEERVFELLRSYGDALAERGLVEPCEIAELLSSRFTSCFPSMAQTVCVRGAASFNYAQLDLLTATSDAGGDVCVLLSREEYTMREELVEVFDARGCDFECLPLEHFDAASASTFPSFLEVAGPHARARAYTQEIARLAQMETTDGATGDLGGMPSVLVVSADPSSLYDALTPRLAAEGIASIATQPLRFAQSMSGMQFQKLADLAERMKAADAGDVPKTEWWPAPELTDWLYCPVSGAASSQARSFDKTMRLSRAKTVEGTLNLLQSAQGQVRSARKKHDDDHPYKQVPCVAFDVFQAIWRGKPVGALKLMKSAVEASPDRAFGLRDGQVRKRAELMMLDRAIGLLTDEARAAGVSQVSAVAMLDELSVRVDVTSRLYSAPDEVAGGTPAWSQVEPRAQVRIMSLEDAAALRPGLFDAAFFADVDLDSYPLSHEEGPSTKLALDLGRAPVELEPAARLRVLFGRAMDASRGALSFSRVTHDRQAKDRYPAAVWTELRTRAEAVGACERRETGEGDVLLDFDLTGGRDMERKTVECEAPQHLSAGAVPYLVLKRRASEDPGAPLVPRLTSASQIEAYSSCPLCWLTSYRIKPQRIDAGFGNMEKGNFVHDVLEHLHRELIDNGMRRVTEQNLPQALELLHETFDRTLAEHAAKRGTEGPLVPLSPVERHQVDEILPQLEAVLVYEAKALAPFAPQYLEYSFNDKNVTYAGWPLGGRIDRIDVDAEGRAVVIDYKHRSDVNGFKLTDPTVPAKRTGVVAIEDPRWLPTHTQSLIYAQAVRRGLGLDTRAGLYFSTKSGAPALRGAASWELLEEEKGDGRIPGLKEGFPAEGGSMDFDALLDRVEAGIAERLGELERGVIAAVDRSSMTDAQRKQTSCDYNHKNAFMRRDA